MLPLQQVGWVQPGQSLPLGSLDLCFLTDKVLTYSCHKLTMLPLNSPYIESPWPLACLSGTVLEEAAGSLVPYLFCLFGATPCNVHCLLLALCPVFFPGRAWRTLWGAVD